MPLSDYSGDSNFTIGGNSFRKIGTSGGEDVYARGGQGGGGDYYTSGWVDSDGTNSVENGNALTFNHNLGETDIIVQVYMAKDANGTDQTLVVNELVQSGPNFEWGCHVQNITSTQLTVQLLQEGTVVFNSVDHTSSNWGTTWTHIKVVAMSGTIKRVQSGGTSTTTSGQLIAYGRFTNGGDELFNATVSTKYGNTGTGFLFSDITVTDLGATGKAIITAVGDSTSGFTTSFGGQAGAILTSSNKTLRIYTEGAQPVTFTAISLP